MSVNGLKRVPYEGWDFFLDEAACRAYYRSLPLTAPGLDAYLTPLTEFFSAIGSDIRTPINLDPGRTDGLCYLLFGYATSETGCELDFYGTGKYASVVVNLYPGGARGNGCLFTTPCIILQVFGNYTEWLDGVPLKRK